MKVIIDRFEGEYAIVEMEIGTTIAIPKVLVPNAQEGDIIKIEVDREETKKRKDTVNKLMNQVFEEE